MLLTNLSRVLLLCYMLIASVLGGSVLGQLQFVPANELTLPLSIERSSPSLSSDGLTLFFASSSGDGEGDWDIWTATRSTRFGQFGAVTNLGPGVNSSSFDNGPSISVDGLSLYFHSTRPGGLGERDLYVATRATTSEPFGDPENLGESVNSEFFDASPYISADGLTLGFQSQRPGGFANQDLYIATRSNTSDPFRAVVDLGPTINFESGGQGSPSFSANGLNLFYAGGGDDRGSDILVSSRASVLDPWGDPVALGPNVNTPFDEDLGEFARDGKSVVFLSNRTGEVRLYESAVACPGDANTDGFFNSADLVQVFQRGEYEDAMAGNSNWSDGDWNNDHEFDSGDLVAAFQTGKYGQAGAVISSVPEPTAAVLPLIGAIVLIGFRRKLR